MDFLQILVVDSTGPYARTFFFNVWEKIGGGGGLQIFFIVVHMGSYGSENFKTLLLLQIGAKSFQPFPELFFPMVHKTAFGIFEILNIGILMNFYSFSLT